MATSTVHLAFVGNGNWASKYHFPALAYIRHHSDRYQLHLRGIYSLDSQRDQETAQQYGFDQVYPSLDALLADETVDAVAAAVDPTVLVEVMRRLVTRRLPIFS